MSLVNLILPLLVLLIHCSLAVNHVLGIDEGVVLYTGRKILEGGSPYVDSWDHKGPILYLFNAFGLWLSSNALWGPGLLEGALLAFAIAVLSHQLKQFWSPFIVYSTVLAFLGSYYLFLESLNLTESWTLSFQIFAYLLIFQESNRSTYIDSKIERGRTRRIYLLLGLAFSLIFYTRPNNATGIFLASIILSLVLHKEIIFYVWKVFSFTFIAFSIMIYLYLRIVGSFKPFLEQFFIYNLDYSSAGSIAERFGSLGHSLFRLAQTPLILVLIVIIIFIFLDKSAKAKVHIAILIGFLGDFISSFLSARGYLHYMIIILPSLLFILGSLQSCLREGQAIYRRATSLVLVLCVVFGGVFGAQKILSRFHSDSGNIKGIARFLESNSKETDYIQILGSETRVLVLAQRQSASSITYSHPANSIFYRERLKMAKKLESDIKARSPKFILRNTNGTCSLNDISCGIGRPNYSEEDLLSLYLWILGNYERLGLLGDYEIWQSKSAMEKKKLLGFWRPDRINPAKS
jgi:hypothetical protein